jgi:ubiquinone/menaquinone biosynthesis C-methylase UbiE
MKVNNENLLLKAKYDIVAKLYDLLDYPWERIYRVWRPVLLEDVRGRVLEAGVGTGRNLSYYDKSVEVVGVDLSEAMLARAAKRAKRAACSVRLVHEDATAMASVDSRSFDWVFSTFMCCVMPDALQPLALEEFARVLKPGGRFRLLELVYSKNKRIRKRQDFFAPFVEKLYGARFDRHTLDHLIESPKFKVTGTRFLKDDVYLLIDGVRV